MILLNGLSKVGFGGYRISTSSIENENALKYAIKCGCNILDTAAGYTNGDSEILIGNVLSNLNNKNVFIITKAGYINNDTLKLLQQLNKEGKGLSDLVHISEDFKHSIHPEFLDAQIKLSLKRLNRKYIDGFLLHSPEYYFEQKNNNNTREEYYLRIKKAFEFLEEKVKKGVIRYYGISSNTLPFLQNEYNSTDLKKLVSIASQVSSINHFKLIQFPFNIIENNAAISSSPNKKSLIEIAKEHGITTFANRPLNANSPTGLLRLVVHDIETLNLNVTNDTLIFEKCFEIIAEQLKKFDDESSISDIAILVFLKDNWMNIINPDGFWKFFHGQFYPLLNLIFDENIPEEALKVFKKFETACWNYHLKAMSTATINYLTLNNLDYLLNKPKLKSLSSNLCNQYLNMGIDHVLVGMRKPSYVDDFKDFFV